MFYKSVYLFEKMFQMFFESLFWKCLWGVVFEKEASVFASWSQVTKSFIYPYSTQIFFSMFSTPFNNFVPPMNLVDNLAFRKLNGTGAGHRTDHECNGAKCLWQFCLKGLWSFHLGDFWKRHRGTYDHFELFCQRYSTCKHGPFWKATCGITLEGASVIVHWFHVFVLY